MASTSKILPTVLDKTISGKQGAVRAVRFNGRVNAVAYNEESTIVFSASIDGTVRAWDCKSRGKDPVQTMDEATDSVLSVAVSDHEILTGSADCRVRRNRIFVVYDIRQGQMLEDFVGSSATCVSFTRDGACTLVSSLDSTVRLLDKETGELLADFTGHVNNEYKADSCLLSTDAQVFSGSEDGKVYCWDLVEGKLLCTLNHPVKQVVHSLSAHPTKKILLTACVGNIFLWKSREDIEAEEEAASVDTSQMRANQVDQIRKNKVFDIDYSKIK